MDAVFDIPVIGLIIQFVVYVIAVSYYTSDAADD
jgi:hypothetical protein